MQQKNVTRHAFALHLFSAQQSHTPAAPSYVHNANCNVCSHLAAARTKIAGSIKRDGLSITKLPQHGRPASAVLELLRAKEARNVRISSGALNNSSSLAAQGDLREGQGCVVAVLRAAAAPINLSVGLCMLCTSPHPPLFGVWRASTTSGSSSLSGAVYIADETHKQLLDEAYCLFSWTNPLHADVFPSVRSEVCNPLCLL